MRAAPVPRRELPPTTGTEQLDPALGTGLVLEPRAWEPGPAVGSSSGSGGLDGTPVLGPG